MLAVDTRIDPDKKRPPQAPLATVATGRLVAGTPPQDSLFSYNLFAITDDAHAQIRQLHLAYYEQVRAVVEAARGGTRVVLINAQLLSLAE